MKLIVEIGIGFNGKLKYHGKLSAGDMTDKTNDEVKALTIAHKTIEEAIAKANDTLEERELTDKLADPRFDEYGNPIFIPYFSIRNV